jgi:hypothetical protein
MGSFLGMTHLNFAIQYNLRWQRLLYILGLTIFVRILHNGTAIPWPWWHIFGFYGLSWMAVVAVDTILRRVLKNWPA